MLTLAFAQIVWSVVFQWDALTGGSNGLVGIWPAAWLAPQAGVLPARRWRARSPAAACSCACCTRRSAWRCAPAATRRCAPRRSASPCRGCSGSPSSSPARRRPRRRAVRVREGHDLARDARRRQVGRRPGDGAARRRAGASRARGSAARSSPGCRTRSRARPTTGARCSASPCWRWCCVFPLGVAGGLKRLFIREAVPRERERRAASSAQRCCSVRGLSKAFGGIRAVDDVSFDLAAGEMLALIGPNGAGKTTCFNMVGGQLAPDAGSVTLAGVELVGLTAARRSGARASAARSRSPRPSPR